MRRSMTGGLEATDLAVIQSVHADGAGRLPGELAEPHEKPGGMTQSPVLACET